MQRLGFLAGVLLVPLATAAAPSLARPTATPRVHVQLVSAAGADVVRPSVTATGLRPAARYVVRVRTSGSAAGGCATTAARTVLSTTRGTLQTVLASGRRWCFGRRYAGSLTRVGQRAAAASFGVTFPAAGQLTGELLLVQSCPVPLADGSCSRLPIAGATVVVDDAAGHDVAQATTGTDGRFAVSGLAPGDYTVMPQRVARTPFTPRPVPVHLDSGEPAFVQVLYLPGVHPVGPAG